MKTETINFRDFVRNNYKNNKKIPTSLLSVAPLPLLLTSINTKFSPSAIFNPPSLIAKGYLLVFIVGGIMIGAALLERHLVSNKNFKAAEKFEDFISSALPFLVIGGLIYFVLINPLL